MDKKGKRNSIWARYKKQIRGYGFEYSLRDFLKQMGVVCAGAVLIGIGYDLRLPGIIAVIVSAGLMIPWLVKSQFRYVYEQQRFSDAVLYMEQMIYSFQKNPKIRQALEDTFAISKGEMQDTIRQAAAYIDQSRGGDIYRKAFAFIEERYPCSPMISLHKFLIQLEEQGGRYQIYMGILLEDIKNWNSRVYLFQADMKRIKRNVLMSIAVTLISGALMTRLVPADYSYTGFGVYQVCITVSLIFLFFFYCFVHAKLNISWLKTDERMDQKQATQLYEDAFSCRWAVKWKQSLPWIVGFALLGLAAGALLKQWILAGVFFVPAAVFAWKTVKTRQRALKRLEREIEKEYPDWLRQVALNLQVSTVQRAVFNTYEEAPEVLKPELVRLFHMFQKYPTGVEPYNGFLEEFSLPEIQSSFRMLYAFHSLGREDGDQQISAVMERNLKFSDKAETLRNEDAVGSAALLTNVPSLVGIGIILLCMILLITGFSGVMSKAMEGLDTVLYSEEQQTEQ